MTMRALDHLPNPPVAAKIAAIVLAAAGLAWWGYVLLEPVATPAGPPRVAVRPADTGARDLTRWLSPGPAQVDVRVAGVLEAGDRGAAVLAINGGPARAYGVGDRLGESVSLARVDADAIVIDEAGKTVRMAVPSAAKALEGGIVPVTSP